MKKLPLVFICGIALGILLLSAFGGSETPAHTHALTPASDNAPTVSNAPATSEATTTVTSGTDNTPAVVDANNPATAESTTEQPEESKVWCERHPERCKHIHERKAKLEAERLEKLQQHCEKHPDDKKCDELKEIAKTPDKQDEATTETGSPEKQLEKHLEEHR